MHEHLSAPGEATAEAPPVAPGDSSGRDLTPPKDPELERLLDGIRQAKREVAAVVSRRRKRTLATLAARCTPAPCPSQFPKVCPSCNASYDHARWSALPLLGYQPDRLGPEPVLEMRDCNKPLGDGKICGNTLAIEVQL